MNHDDGLAIHPLTPDRWEALEDLFGPERGASSGCWCMSLRVPASTFRAMDPAPRRHAFRAIVEAGPPPGLLAYAGDRAIGWCAVGPRPSLARFATAKASQPLVAAEPADAAKVFAIACFYIRSGSRKRGLMARLATAAIVFAKAQGAEAIEACTIDADKPLVWGEGFVGITSVFSNLGFHEIARRSPRRPLMRLTIAPEH